MSKYCQYICRAALVFRLCVPQTERYFVGFEPGRHTLSLYLFVCLCYLNVGAVGSIYSLSALPLSLSSLLCSLAG